MPYTQNPYLPRVRAKAAALVRERGWSVRQTARYFGVQHSSILRWLNKAPDGPVHEIPTESSRPHTSPRETPRPVVERIREIRLKHGRCAEVVHAQAKNEGIQK